MPIKVKLDEDLSPRVSEPLLSRGYSAHSVASQGWCGLPDVQLWSPVQAEQEVLVTADKGFGDIRRFPPGTHAGIVLLRPDRESILDFRTLLTKLLEAHALEDLAGATTAVTPRRIRIRLPVK